MKIPEWIPCYDEQGNESDILPWQDILFLLGNGEYHVGTMHDESKLRKCNFISYNNETSYSCDRNTPIDKRVTHWYPVPQFPCKDETIKETIKTQKYEEKPDSLGNIFRRIESAYNKD